MDITVTQLARWQRAGLLVGQRQRPLGKGHGTETVNPLGSGPRLLRAYSLQKGERRLPHIAWRLWWEGYAVPVDILRQFLTRAAGSWERMLDGASPKILPSDSNEPGRIRKAVPRYLRKRLGSGYQSFVRLLLQLLLPDPQPELKPHELHRIAKAYGFDPVLLNAKFDSSGGFWASMRTLGSAIIARPWQDWLNSVLGEELDQARKEVKTLTEFVLVVGPLLERSPESGDRIITLAAQFIHPDAEMEQAFLVAAAVSARRLGHGADLDWWMQTARITLQSLAPFRALQHVFPDVFTPERLSQWSVDPEEQASLIADAESLRRQLPEKIERLKSHLEMIEQQ